jgi:hypothetical protein
MLHYGQKGDTFIDDMPFHRDGLSSVLVDQTPRVTPAVVPDYWVRAQA